MKLIKPIKAHNDLLTELTFREPNGEDLAVAGFPTIYESGIAGARSVVDAAAMSNMISRLAGIPPSSVKQMNVLDWTRAMGEVMSFFAEAAPQGTA